VVAVLCCALVGCKRHYEFNTALIGIPKAQELFKTIPNIDVILVAPDGTVFPKDLLIRADTYAVVWVAVGKKLELTFENSTIKPLCELQPPGVICAAGPLTLPPGPYMYKGILTDNEGKEHKIDPNVEIVK
jgi:hypothetical protein